MVTAKLARRLRIDRSGPRLAPEVGQIGRQSKGKEEEKHLEHGIGQGHYTICKILNEGPRSIDDEDE